MKCKINVKNDAKNNLELKLKRLKRIKRSREKNQEKQKNSLQPYPYHREHRGNKNAAVNFSVIDTSVNQENLNEDLIEKSSTSTEEIQDETISVRQISNSLVSDTVSKPDAVPTSPTSVPIPVPEAVPVPTLPTSVKISKENPDKRFHRLEIWFADLGEPNDKFIEAGWHPVLIISNDTNNELSPIVTVAPISSKTNKLYLPGHVFIDSTDVDSTGVCGNVRGMRIVNYPFRPGSILLEQITVLDKRQLEKYAGKITAPERIKTLNKAIGAFLGI